MAEGPTHERVAKALAKKFNAEYNPHKGVDIVTKKIAIEVETNKTIPEATRQLSGHKQPSYIATTSNTGTKKALEQTKGTTIGVMDSKGHIIKKSTR